MFSIAQNLAANTDAVGAAFGGAAIIFTIIMGFVAFIAIVLSILTTVFWIWMLIDAAQRDFDDPNNKILWIILLILLGFIGAIVYYFVIRKKEGKPVPQAPSPSAPPAPPVKKKRKIAKK